jgi:hypothetical protein
MIKVYAFLCGGDQADLAINDPFDENVGTKQYSPYFFYPGGASARARALRHRFAS